MKLEIEQTQNGYIVSWEERWDVCEEEIDPMVQKEQMRAMWMAMKKDPKEFERQYAKGEVTF